MNRDNKKLMDTLFKAAKNEKKGDWSVYTYYKRQLDDLLLDNDEYEKAVINLCTILKL